MTNLANEKLARKRFIKGSIVPFNSRNKKGKMNRREMSKMHAALRLFVCNGNLPKRFFPILNKLLIFQRLTVLRKRAFDVFVIQTQDLDSQVGCYWARVLGS